MTEAELRKKGLTRRDFLKLSSALVFAGIFGRGVVDLANDVQEIIDPRKMGMDKEAFERMEREVSEIMEMRKELGFNYLPLGIRWRLWYRDGSIVKIHTDRINCNEWPKKIDPVEIKDVDPVTESYAQRAVDIITRILGKRASFFTRSISNNLLVQNRDAFYPGERYFNLNENVRTRCPDLEGVFTGLVLHECIGHGTDPELSLNSNIPLKDFIKIEHGKWKMLTQAFKVSGEFFLHPGDGALPVVKYEVAKVVGKLLVRNKFDIGSLSENRDYQQQLLLMIRKAGINNDISQIIFTRRVCSELGDLLVEWLIEDPTRFEHIESAIKSKYQDVLDDSLEEIYAEMMRIGLIIDQESSPNNNVALVQGNQVINFGIAEVLGTIRGEKVNDPAVYVAGIRREIGEVGPDLIKLWEAENKVIDGNVASDSQPINEETKLVEEEIEGKADIRNAEINALQDALFSFYEGRLVGVKVGIYTEEQLEIIRSYAKLLARLQNDKPILYLDIEEFEDENMHAWHSEKIDFAVDKENISGLLNSMINEGNIDAYLDSNQEGCLQNRVRILQEYFDKTGDFEIYEKNPVKKIRNAIAHIFS